jgi:hypothetical protein
MFFIPFILEVSDELKILFKIQKTNWTIRSSKQRKHKIAPINKYYYRIGLSIP